MSLEKYDWARKDPRANQMEDFSLLNEKAEAVSFTPVNEAQLRSCNLIFTYDPIVRTVYDIAVSNLTVGGIIFQRGDKVLTIKAKHFYNRVWLRFVKELVAQLWTYGFAVATTLPHASYVGIPVILPLSMYTVRFRDCPFGRRVYQLVPNMVNPSTSMWMGQPVGLAEMERALRGAVVFEHYPPDGHGNVRSKLMSLWDDRAYLDWLISCDRVAARINSVPPIVTEEIKESFDPNHTSYLSGRLPSAELKEADHIMVTQGLDAGQGGLPSAAARAAAQRLNDGLSPETGALADSALTHMAIPDKRRFANFYGATPPAHLLSIRESFEERIGALFGVPRAIFCTSNTYKHAGSNVAYSTFRSAQHSLKMLILPMLEDMYHRIYTPHHEMEALCETLPLTEERLEASQQVFISLPGIPIMEEMRQLYMEGTLTYKGYVEYIQATQGISRSSLNAQPGLSLQELHNVKPTAEGDEPFEPDKAART